MTEHKLYGATFGPYLYNDTDGIADPDGDFTNFVEHATVSDGGHLCEFVELLDYDHSHGLMIYWDEDDSGHRELALKVVGGNRALTLNENFTIGDGYAGTLTYSGSSKVLTVEDNAIVSQDYTADASPTFATVKLTNLGDGKIPKHTSDAVGFEDSILAINGSVLVISGTVACSDLTDGYIPYHVSDADGLANTTMSYISEAFTIADASLTLLRNNVYQDPPRREMIIQHSPDWLFCIESEWPLLDGYIDYYFNYRCGATDFRAVGFHSGRLQLIPNGEAGHGVMLGSKLAPAGRLEVEDGGTAASILVKITQDDGNVYGLVIGNDSHSTTDTTGLREYVDNSGHAYISNNAAGNMYLRTPGTVNSSSLFLQSEMAIYLQDYNDGSATTDFAFSVGANPAMTIYGDGETTRVIFQEDSSNLTYLSRYAADSFYCEHKVGGSWVGSWYFSSNGSFTLNSFGAADTSYVYFYIENAFAVFDYNGGAGARGAFTVTVNNDNFVTASLGQNDTRYGQLNLYGKGAGSNEGGKVVFYTAADHDTTTDYYTVQAYEDDLLIGPNTDLDALKLTSDKDLHITAGTVSCYDLTDGYVPYHVSDAAGLANSGLRSNGTNQSIGIVPSELYKLYIYDNPTNSNSSILRLTTRSVSSSNGTYTPYGMIITDTPLISTGVSDSGIQSALNTVLFRNNVAVGSDDGGTLSKIYTLYILYGHYNTNTGATPTTSSVYGIYLSPVAKTGTIGALYGIRLDNYSTGGTVGAAWGIYFDTNYTNVLGGTLKVGDLLTPVGRLEVEDGGTSASMLVKITQDDANVYGLVIGNDTYSTTDTNGLKFKVDNSGNALVTWTAGDFTVGPDADTDALKLDSNKNLYITDGDLYVQVAGSTTVTLDATNSQILVGVNDIVYGTISLYGQATGSYQGGILLIYTAADYDTTTDYYKIMSYADELYIQSSEGRYILYTDAAALYSQQASFFIGKNDTTYGIFTAYSNGAGSPIGGGVHLHLAADYDSTITTFQMNVSEDDLLIGPDTDADALKLDSNKDLYITAGNLNVYGKIYTQSYFQTKTQNANSGIVLGDRVNDISWTIYSDTNILHFDLGGGADKLTLNDGDLYITAGSLVLPASEYCNFGGTQGSDGYGLRDNAGYIQVKHSDYEDTWEDIERTHEISKSVILVDDFVGLLGGGLGWSSAYSGAGAGTSVAGSAEGDHVGNQILQTGTTTTGYVTIYLAYTYMAYTVLGGDLKFEWVLKTTNLSDGTDTYKIWVGLGDQVTASDFTNGIFFTYTNGESGGRWECITMEASSETLTDSGVGVAANTWYRLGVIVSADGATAKFYINGSLVATHTTDIVESDYCGPICKIVKSAGTTSRLLMLDAFYLRKRVSR